VLERIEAECDGGCTLVGAALPGIWIVSPAFMVVMLLFVGLMAWRADGWPCGVERPGPAQYSWGAPGPREPKIAPVRGRK